MEQHRKATLVLEDGSSFTGFSFGAECATAGEVVFNTGMVGYPESLTDPSYVGQILIITYPLVGNYGVPPSKLDSFGLEEFYESSQIRISALIVSHYSHTYSHWNSDKSLSAWLKENNVPALHGIDTRMLTKKIREKGSMLGKIIFGDENDGIPFSDPNTRNLVAELSTKEVRTFGNGNLKILAVDCGIKYNIIRYLVGKDDVQLQLVPWDFDFRGMEYDGLFLSNGPGDPTKAQQTIEHVKWAYSQDKPIFGICLGNQLMSLAAGAKTYKMKFGNRGMNQPCIAANTGRCYITPQNHGFAVDTESLPSEWKPLFTNANDGTNEGIVHTTKPFFSVQFHPEARGGPNDTEYLFDIFLDKVREHKRSGTTKPLLESDFAPVERTNTRVTVSKVLILGSGGLSIGQAGEFDYSGSQAIKALKEEGIKTVLINPNIATIQTSKGLADKVYFLPITADFVIDVIKQEQPDGVLLTFGGQTALNCGIELYKRRVFEEYNIKVLGTPIETIIATEDRELFANILAEIDVKVAPSEAATTVEEAVAAANRIGYPVILRAAYALGGLGSGFAENEFSLRELSSKAFNYSSQVLVEKSIKGWKEIEYEVVRDCRDNCVTVCNMENFDPLGVHTGDSIVVAPSQTLSNQEYFKLRSVAIKTIRRLGVVGECNIQYALDPFSEEYYVIEVNARLSRSSALASKATGYPLAFVAAKLALGFDLTEIPNLVTRSTIACFEPALDYVVVKFPRWDLSKFSNADTLIGSSMKSVGEVMAIGRTFEEAIQKSIRMVDPSQSGFTAQQDFDNVRAELSNPSPKRILAIAAAMRDGITVDEIHSLSKIDKFFLYKLQSILDAERALAQYTDNMTAIPYDLMRYAKTLGFADRQIAAAVKSTERDVRSYRKQLGVVPCVKQIDTLAAEFPATTNYLYMTYGGTEDDISFGDHGIMVLGSGAYRIGSSVEFDWCAVGCVRTLRSLGRKTIMVNYNPETVSTDYDECDRLYFDELTLERVLDIYERETSEGVIVSVGGQTPNNLAMHLHESGVKILGTSAEQIDRAEDRFKFSRLLDELGVDQPEWKELTSFEAACEFAEKVGYPVLVRPSYVLSGAGMNVAFNSEDLMVYLKESSDVSSDHPVVVSKFIEEAKEVEMDAVAFNGEIVVYAISEHVENAGVHSGDATLVLPAQNLYVETMRRVKSITKKIAASLKICGPFNIQYLAKENDIKVIECNLRASRSFPFASKVFNTDFIEVATKAMLGINERPQLRHILEIDYVGIKAPQFSFTRLHGADPVLGVEMASTGEVACFGEDLHEAFLKSLLSTGFKIPTKGVLLSFGEKQGRMLPVAQHFVELGLPVYATPGTADYFIANNIPVTKVSWPVSSAVTSPSGSRRGSFSNSQFAVDDGDLSVLDVLMQRKVDLVINFPKSTNKQDITNGYMLRRKAVDLSMSLITNGKCALLFASAMKRVKHFEIKSWQEYIAKLESY